MIAHAAFLTDGVREHATVVFPAEARAEKEGTVTHPDGRVQRLRPAIARQGEVRAEWSVLAELARAWARSAAPLSGAAASAALFAAVPFYGGLTLAELAGHGVRWPARPQAAALAAGGAVAPPSRAPRRRRRASGAAAPWHLPLDLGGARGRGLAGAPLPARAPARRGAPADAAGCGLRHGAQMLVSTRPARGRGRRSRCATRRPPGTAFLERGLAARAPTR